MPGTEDGKGGAAASPFAPSGADALPPAAPWQADTGCTVLARVDSTMAEAARRLPTLAGPEWILALRQEAGRGRQGRGWADPPGNFAATHVFRPAQGLPERALFSFVAALALDNALRDLGVPAARLSIKWPNDVLLDGGKLAGILLEGAGDHLSIGFGVNLAHAPDPADLVPGLHPPVALAAATGLRVPPEDLLARLAPAFARWRAQLDDYGFGPIRTAWLARAARLGAEIRARTAREEWRGTFETIDATGALVLKTAQGTRTIPAADVFF